MKRTFQFLTLVFITLSFLSEIFSQEVSTIVPLGSTFNDGLAMDSDGNIYASRYFSTSVTKITPAGMTSIFADGFSSPNGTDFGRDGYLYVPSNVSAGSIVKVSPAGVSESFIPSISYPTTALFRDDGKMYICSCQDNRVYLADSTGSYSLLYQGNGMNCPVGMRLDENGNLLIANYTGGKIFSVSPAGVFSTIAQLNTDVGFIEYSNGYIYATGIVANKIFKVTMNGQITVLAGTGLSGQINGPAASATFSGPNGILASPGGDSLFISDFYARSLRLISGVTTGVTNISSAVPDGFSIDQNYPNPFNPSTTIEYQIPVKGIVSVKVFDIHGRELETLVNENQSPGRYRIEFRGNNYSSGVYYYTINSDNFSGTKKMILIK